MLQQVPLPVRSDFAVSPNDDASSNEEQPPTSDEEVRRFLKLHLSTIDQLARAGDPDVVNLGRSICGNAGGFLNSCLALMSLPSAREVWSFCLTKARFPTMGLFPHRLVGTVLSSSDAVLEWQLLDGGPTVGFLRQTQKLFDEDGEPYTAVCTLVTPEQRALLDSFVTPENRDAGARSTHWYVEGGQVFVVPRCDVGDFALAEAKNHLIVGLLFEETAEIVRLVRSWNKGVLTSDELYRRVADLLAGRVFESATFALAQTVTVTFLNCAITSRGVGSFALQFFARSMCHFVARAARSKLPPVFGKQLNVQ